MPGFWRRAPLFLMLGLMAAGAGAVVAQPRPPAQVQAPAAPPPKDPDSPTDLSEGKTPIQLFADNCAVCHQRPNGLAKSTDARSLANFLRQHYTSSAQTAAAMAGYLASLPAAAPAATPANRGRPSVDQANRPEDTRPTARRGRPDTPAGRAPESKSAEVPPPPKPKVPEIPD